MIRYILLSVVALCWGTASILYTAELTANYNASQKIPDIVILHTTSEVIKEKVVVQKEYIKSTPPKVKLKSTSKPINVSKAERDCMTIALWSESRSDTPKGVEAAALTMLVRQKAYEQKQGKTSICSLVQKPDQYHGIVRSEFYSDLVWRAKNGYKWKNKLPLDNPIKRRALNKIELAIAKTLSGKNFLQLKNIQVTHFSNEASAKKLGWFKDPTMQFIGKFGHHLYFNEINFTLAKL